LLTAEQVRAARAMLRWDQAALAEAVGVSVETIKRLEGQDGPLVSGRHATISGVEKVLAEAGIVFIEADRKLGPGVRLRLKKVSPRAGSRS
jgi:transcriptional regulator with XRE-family HTH domain